MGKGLALECKNRYPEMFKEHCELFKKGELDVGKLFLYKKSTPWILNFPTKAHWRGKSKLEYIGKGLQEFKNCYQVWGIKSIAFPQLGCRNGPKRVVILTQKYWTSVSRLNDLTING